LLATIASADGRGTALLERDGGEVKVLQHGDMLAPGEQVSTIAVNGIELSTSNGKRRIELASFLENGIASPAAGKGRATTALGTSGGMPAPGDIVNVFPREMAPDAASGRGNASPSH
jgi:hypothetical protein